MIRRLRGEFIRIAMLAVSLVLLLLTVSVNAVNYISVSRQQDRTLEMIVSHQGTIPAMPKEAKSGPRPNGHFSPETPYDTRFFVLRYTDSGDLTQSDLTHIASVTEADTEPYLQAALSHGEGAAGRAAIGSGWCGPGRTAGWRCFWTAGRRCAPCTGWRGSAWRPWRCAWRWCI